MMTGLQCNFLECQSSGSQTGERIVKTEFAGPTSGVFDSAEFQGKVAGKGHIPNRFLSDVEATSPGLTLKTTAQVKLRGSAAASNY